MKNYLRVHLVQAEPMTRGEHLKSKNLAFIPVPGTSEDDPGYLVVYPDGYRSWCPKDSFEKQGFELQRTDRITPEDVAAFVALSTQNAEKIGEKTTLVARKYPTGIEDYATSSCVDPKNYDREIGEKFASEKLDDRVWTFLGWLLAWAKNGVNRKVIAPPENVDEHGDDEPDREDDENKAEMLGKALGTFLVPLALLGGKPCDKFPDIHVNVWSFGSR